MREIKFRAWNEWNRKMFYDDICCYLSLDANGEMNQCSSVAMQFTGLLDKNGTPIYEGDVLIYEWSSEDGPVSDKLAVEWLDEMAGFVVPGLPEELEVIGNIYEHPHLLEAK